MKFKYLFLIILFCYLSFLFLSPQKNNKEFNVAIILPVSHVALEEIKQGFIETISKSLDCNFEVYNANGSKTLLKAQAEEIAQKKYNLIFSVATAPSIIMKEVLKQRNNTTPLVCGAVDEPIKNGLTGNNITAVTSKTNFSKQIDYMVKFKPNVKKILLVYNPNSNLERQKIEIEQLLSKKNINLTSIEIFNLNELGSKVSGIISNYDIVFILKDNLIVSGVEALVNLCNRFNVILYASDLNSVQKGATMGYGVTEYTYGQESAKQAIDILKHKKRPADISIKFVDNFEFQLNKKAAQLQDLKEVL